MTEGQTTLERLTKALGSSHDHDIVAALGMAEAAAGELNHADARALRGLAVTAREVAQLGAHITTLQAHASQSTYNQALASIRLLVGRLNQARRWHLDEEEIHRTAESSLLLHLHPNCGHCNGQGTELTGNICKRCHGSGKRPYPRRLASEVESTMAALQWIQGLMERAVARRMQ